MKANLEGFLEDLMVISKKNGVWLTSNEDLNFVDDWYDSIATGLVLDEDDESYSVNEKHDE